jgi:hypothetical protein
MIYATSFKVILRSEAWGTWEEFGSLLLVEFPDAIALVFDSCAISFERLPRRDRDAGQDGEPRRLRPSIHSRVVVLAGREDSIQDAASGDGADERMLSSASTRLTIGHLNINQKMEIQFAR